MSRKREKPIEPGSTIQLYIPQDIPVEVLAWLNSPDNQPLNTKLLKLVELKINESFNNSGDPQAVQSIVENMFNEKIQGFKDEILKMISSQGGSVTLIDSTKEIFEKKKHKLNSLGDL